MWLLRRFGRTVRASSKVIVGQTGCIGVSLGPLDNISGNRLSHEARWFYIYRARDRDARHGAPRRPTEGTVISDCFRDFPYHSCPGSAMIRRDSLNTVVNSKSKSEP